MDSYREVVFKLKDKEEESLIVEDLNIFNFTKFYVEDDVEQSESFLKLYFSLTDDQDKDVLQILSKYNLELISDQIIKEKNWLEEWIKSVQVFEFIDGVWINPYDNKKVEKPGLVLNIIPGSAFGTGTHVTTKLAAKLLSKVGCQGKCVLDVGTGSGILAVYAKKMGAKYVRAIDNDIFAIEKAKEAARLNQVDIDIQMSDLLKDVELDIKFDVIVSNIIAEVLIELIKDAKFHEILNNKADIIFSGIIKEREEIMLEESKKCGLELKERVEDSGWVALWLQKVI
ncbi:MAG TPA: 50S ribosomal protein L11 methyltransferase [Defluviitoga sp.]|nr:50S ribosomal protein L11 methyltransferase [Defluviitoga sp.]HPZ29529.1 50S ribosomal protein L11 methyltransferase [Defluviitoga sp.]HQD63361.1 50S ribosomal protein L11 methyltransferase [Defluviitoga sp.]